MVHFLKIVALAVGFGGFTIAPAHAYLDPGTGTIVLQSLLAGTAGAALVVKLYWRSFLSYFRRRGSRTDNEEGHSDGGR
jgi:hypothetical protein